MIDLSKYRIIDLSQEIVPGEQKIDGRYLHGEPLAGRPVEVQEFIALGARMHFIQGQTHIGTHAEAPYKYSDTGADFGSMPISTYLGEAVACGFTYKKAGEPITAADFRQASVRTGDIVLAWGNADTRDDPPYLSDEALDWLIETQIKLLGIEDIAYSPPGTPEGESAGDARLHLGGIPVVENLQGLAQIKRPRVFFIGLPIKMCRVTASWTRAIVLEEE